jgi:hypothetical protein
MPPRNEGKPHLTTNREDLSQQAVRLRKLGLSILPIADDKSPTMRTWKHLQTTPASIDAVRRWFHNPMAVGVGIILGAISGDLVARDFDDRDSYQRWAKAFPNLAATLPTVETLRGYHVYARIKDCPFRRFEDGEMRAGGTHYVVVPPSRLSNGAVYSWKIPLTSLQSVPRLTLDEAGLFQCWSPELPQSSMIELTERTEEPESSEVDRSRQKSTEEQREQIVTNREQTTTEGEPRTTEDHQGHNHQGLIEQTILPIDEFIEQAVRETCPTALGQRNRNVFEFARWLKSRVEFFEADPRTLERYVLQWWETARPYIGTKDFDETRADFNRAFRKVRIPKGRSPLDDALMRANRSVLPKSAMRYTDHKKQLLVKLCRELQTSSQCDPFYLSCRSAGKLLDITYQQANAWLYLLCEDEILHLEVPGTAGKNGKAARYRYLAAED